MRKSVVLTGVLFASAALSVAFAFAPHAIKSVLFASLLGYSAMWYANDKLDRDY